VSSHAGRRVGTIGGFGITRYLRGLGKFDWDRERREERARAHGREPVHVGLSTGLAETRRKWRASGARGIWVQPLVGKRGGIVVLLPKRQGRVEWAVAVSSESGTETKRASGGGEHALSFTVHGVWNVQVLFDDDLDNRHLEDEFDNFYPGPFS
jgi:hypothetical protein